MIVEFNDRGSASIKSFPVKKTSEIKATICLCLENCSCLQSSLSRVFSMKFLTHFAFPRKLLKNLQKLHDRES